MEKQGKLSKKTAIYFINLMYLYQKSKENTQMLQFLDIINNLKRVDLLKKMCFSN